METPRYFKDSETSINSGDIIEVIISENGLDLNYVLYFKVHGIKDSELAKSFGDDTKVLNIHGKLYWKDKFNDAIIKTLSLHSNNWDNLMHKVLEVFENLEHTQNFVIDYSKIDISLTHSIDKEILSLLTRK